MQELWRTINVYNNNCDTIDYFQPTLNTKQCLGTNLWAIPFNIRTLPVDDLWDSSGVKGFELGIRQE